MRNNCFLLVILFVLGFVSESTANDSIALESFESLSDSTRLAELDLYWNELTRTVKEGDYEGYGAAYHPDAVVVFTNGKTKKSVPISTALLNWKQGFDNTKIGLTNDAVEFRLSQRIGNETTAHETGIFHYKSIDADHNIKASYLVHFEMLFIKKDGQWLSLMEYQKSSATEEEWEALK